MNLPEAISSKVLVVDDDEINRLLIRETLQRSGLIVEEVESGEEAIEHFNQNPSDIILLDVVMEGMDGFDTCTLLRRLPTGLHVPIIMMTGLNDIESINHAYESGATDFITKPINYTILVYRMRYMMRANQIFVRLHNTEAKIVRLAYYDRLTNLPNQVFLNEYFNKIIEQSNHYNKRFAILSLDIDHFKRINNTWGQKTGNQLLKQIAERLIKCISVSDYLTYDDLTLPEQAYQPNDKNDILIRMGGDEFVILLTDINLSNEVQNVVKHIYNILRKPFTVKKENFHLTVSSGIALFPDDGQDADTLLMCAEMAMHNAKQQGRNSFQFFHQSMNIKARQRLILENELHKAIENEEFEVYYQPKVELNKYKTIGMEALVRWNHPKKGIISPADFIPLAEETDLICILGEWVLRQACKHTKHWHEQGFELKVAVNISAIQLKKSDLLNHINNALKESNLSPKYLELEITEGVLMEDSETSHAVLLAIKNIGVSIAMDDFGTGYSSLSYLKKFPFDTLKIDQSFMPDIDTEPDSTSLIPAIIALSKCLKLKVVAEGVETEAQLNFMKKYECDEIQGYLFSPPIPPEEFENWLNSMEKAG